MVTVDFNFLIWSTMTWVMCHSTHALRRKDVQRRQYCCSWTGRAKNGWFFHRPLFVCGLWQMRCVTILGFSLYHLLCASSAILQISQQYQGNSLLVWLSLMLLSLLLLSLFGSNQPHLGQLPRDLLLEAWIYSQVLFHLSRLLFCDRICDYTLLVFFLWSHIVSFICDYTLLVFCDHILFRLFAATANQQPAGQIFAHLIWASSTPYNISSQNEPPQNI